MRGLKNLFGWNRMACAASACGSACGAGDPNPAGPRPSACGSACGAGDPKPAGPRPSACGAGDPKK